jgi:phospholipid-binding lipoprotein MlaA
MNKRQLNHLFMFFLFFVFLSTGCAHRPVTPSLAVSEDIQLGQNRQITSDGAEQISQDPDMADNSDGNFFDEEFEEDKVQVADPYAFWNKTMFRFHDKLDSWVLEPLARGYKAFTADPDMSEISDDDFFDKEFEEDKVQVADPLFLWNKAMFHFNDKLYFWALKPLAKGYKAVAPDFFRAGVKNFFRNITTPIRLVNCILQGKGNAAVIEFSRFFVNTTAGVLGFGSPADKYPELIPRDEEDLGQTLAKYGLGNGIYLVWPVLGPSTLRDSIGLAGDFFLDPVSYVKPTEAALGIRSVDIVNKTSFRIGDYESLKEAAIDPYTALRDVYLQFRKKKIKE